MSPDQWTTLHVNPLGIFQYRQTEAGFEVCRIDGKEIDMETALIVKRCVNRAPTEAERKDTP